MRRALLLLALAAPAALAAQTPRGALQLEAIRVAPGERGCVVDPRSGPRTAALWDAARGVLQAAREAEERGGVYRVRRFRRELDASTALVRSVREDSATVSRLVPFRSLPPGELARGGYVWREGSENVFAAPDARVLLSDEFLDGHCFRTAAGQGDAAGLVGLAFEPVRGRRLPDVAGTLWLDPASAELRFMEFAYTGLPDYATGDRWGGRVEFGRAEGGAWIVRRWTLRLPVVGRASEAFGRGMVDARVGVVTIQEVGGEVLPSRPQRAAASGGVVAGVVFDSTRGGPLAGAYVALSGTTYTARTDAAGAFRLDRVPPGRYGVTFTHPRLDSLRWVVPPVPVEVAAGGESTAALAIPARALGRAAPRPLAGDTVRLEGVVGTAAARDRTLEHLGFYERKRGGVGTQWSGDEFRAMGRGRVTDHISGYRRIVAVPTGQEGYTFRQSNGGFRCWVPVFIDGRHVPARELNDLRREDVVAVEIYEEDEPPGNFTLPAHYAPMARNRACGAIAVWTVRAR